MQQYQCRSGFGLRSNKAVLQPLRTDVEKAGIGERHYRAPGPSARSLKRWILPVAVFGRSLRNSIQRGYLYGASFCLQCSCNAWISASLALSGDFSTTKAFG